jgi:ABC-type sulfate transport system substrate-binding protein
VGPNVLEIVTPSVSVLAQPSVSLVDAVVDRKGTRKVAQAYLEFLYTPAAQAIIAKHRYRPVERAAAAASPSSAIELFTIDLFGGWAAAQKKHFDDGGVFDRIEGAR